MKQIAFAGHSMYPSLRPGDTLVLRPVPPHEIRVGDILCLPENRAYVAHRVVRMTTSEKHARITLKGDNLAQCPAPIEIPVKIPMETMLYPLFKVVLVKRPAKGLITPRFGPILACLSRHNLTYGIIKGKLGKFLKNTLK